ncbi:MAG: hypothetical protein ACLQNE_06590 [Thermoguttaceae bacterium]
MRKLILYNLTDVVNLVELMETTIKLKHPQLSFPGEITAPRPPPERKFDAGRLGPWIGQTLSSWGQA